MTTCVDRQLISDEDMFVWLLRGFLKADTECEILAAHDKALKKKILQQKYYKENHIANADHVNNFTGRVHQNHDQY
jgi:hypothetical protein